MRFGLEFDSPMEKLKKLVQTSSLEAYQESFDNLVGRTALTESQKLQCYLGGLQQELCNGVKMFAPRTVLEATRMAKFQERSLELLQKRLVPAYRTRSSWSEKKNAVSNTFDKKLMPQEKKGITEGSRKSILGKPAYTFQKKLSPKEMDEHTAQNLCFFCHDKFFPGHDCLRRKKMQVFLIEVGEVDHLDSIEVDFVSEGVSNEPTHSVEPTAIQGDSSHPMMRLIGWLDRKRVHVLIDTGSTYNFISQKLCKEGLNILQPMHPLRITVADGGLIHGAGRCEGIMLKLQGQWGVIQWDFTNMAMEFSMNGMHVKLQAVKENKSRVVFASKLHQLVIDDSFCYMLQLLPCSTDSFCYMLQLLPCSTEAMCCSVTTEELEDPVMRAHRQSVLYEFQEVFETPTQLPPFRVYNPSLESHVVHLRQVLQILKAHTFYVKRSKCAFFTTRIEYLGDFITPTGVTTDPIKVQAVRAWLAPQTVKQLREFLGLTGYYMRFIKGYSIIVSPLTDLLKRDSFHWPQEAHTTFTTLKDALSNSPVLAIPNMQKPFVVETDASSTGVGVVLMQDGHPVAFISKVLSPKNMLLSVYDRELLALVHAVSKWHQYLSLNTFTILTDQHSLKYLLEQRLSTPAQYRWVTKLMGLSYEILYKKGKDNVAADALSRASHGEVLQLSVSSISSKLWDSLLKRDEQDSTLQDLKLQVLSNPALHPHFSVLDNLLYRKQKLVISNDGQVWLLILQWLHSSHQGGHSGIRASIARIKSMLTSAPASSRGSVAKYSHGLHRKLPKSHGKDTIWLGISHSLTTAYHPQSDGQSEVLNRCLEHYLRAMTWQRAKEWVNWLPLAEWWYNTTYHSAIQATPYEIVYDQAPPQYLPYCPQSTKVEAVDRSFIVREEMIQKLQGNLFRAQAQWGSLDDPKESFKILKRRSIQRHNRAVTELLVQWKGEAMEEATWKLLYKLKLQFPYFDVAAVP
ncbi:hypothetical protein KIW84_040249 [Lathyrus oleraceus]|uniref:Integrase catalytic domain-containing protein n=1 Tax=Pisum sativum TaxID=3888 RepID=A0A9D4X4T9_PEA|nr:hypothetical protein KIW84_040249 [Pisum sativum]